MIQRLNYCSKAIEEFGGFEKTATPLARAGFRYLTEKLRQAQVFLLPEHGVLLDRDKARPQVPGLVFRPPYPVVALEYPAPAATARRHDPFYTAAASSRRIALAWEWTNDLPRSIHDPELDKLPQGVVVASIAYFDEQAAWMPVAAAAHLAYDGEWADRSGEASAFRDAMLASMQIKPAQVRENTFTMSIVPILAEAIRGLRLERGEEGTLDLLHADLTDEVNAYVDFCFALACKNVEVEKQPAPKVLNLARSKRGRAPLFDYHILRLSTEGGEGGIGLGATDRNAARPHLRRGHVRHLRHLGPDRITWVNATMVRGQGRGFAAKDYVIGRAQA